MNVIERINMLKKMVGEAENIVNWQSDIYTALHNIDADWLVSGQFSLSRMPRAASGLFLEGNGAAADPIYNALVAANIPNLDTSKIATGTFPVARGGTGLSTIALGGILYASALNVLSRLAPTAANQVLRSTAANALQFAALLAADIPNLAAAKITSGQFPLSRMPRAASGLFLEGNGAAAPIYNALVAANIPNLDTAKITTGRFPTSRLPAMTDEKIWKGTGGNVEEVDMPAAGGLTFFGNGSDGNATISSNTTLTRDMHYNNLTVNNGITLTTDGYCVFVKETLTLNGIVSAKGKNGVGAGSGARGNGHLHGGRGGAGKAIVGETEMNSGGGGAGGNSCLVCCKILAGNGTITVNGGDGGDADYTVGSWSALGGAGEDTDRGGGDGGAGGGGGSGGSVIYPTGSIFQVNEGGGGGGGGSVGSPYRCGGGGGGGGGVLFVIYLSKTGTPTFTAAGGNGGAGAAGGTAGANGSNGRIYEIVNA